MENVLTLPGNGRIVWQNGRVLLSFGSSIHWRNISDELICWDIVSVMIFMNDFIILVWMCFLLVISIRNHLRMSGRPPFDSMVFEGFPKETKPSSSTILTDQTHGFVCKCECHAIKNGKIGRLSTLKNGIVHQPSRHSRPSHTQYWILCQSQRIIYHGMIANDRWMKSHSFHPLKHHRWYCHWHFPTQSASSPSIPTNLRQSSSHAQTLSQIHSTATTVSQR